MEQIHHKEIQLRQQQFITLYRNAFPAFARYVSRMGGDLEEAKDIFQDALVVWYEKTGFQDITMVRSEKAYILGVAKYLWIKCYKSSLAGTPLLSELDLEGIEEETSLSETKLMHVLETAGRKCMDLLKSFYYDKLSPAKLARQYGFSSERSATAQKYKCLEKVRNEVKQKSLSYADFIE